jgi:hypothetical protein
VKRALVKQGRGIEQGVGICIRVSFFFLVFALAGAIFPQRFVIFPQDAIFPQH